MDELVAAAEPVAPAAEALPVAEPAPGPAPIPVIEGARRYDTLMILPVRYEGGSLEALVKEITALMATAGAIVHRTETIGRRTLTFKIQKQSEGVYVNVVFSAPPAAIKLIERELKLHGTIMRFLTTSIES